MKNTNNYKWGIIWLLFIYSQILVAQTSININVIGQPIVGETVTIEVTANHPDGINKIFLVQDDDYLNKTVKYCNGVTSYTFQKDVSINYIGNVMFSVFLWGVPNTYITETSISVNFICESEYCNPEPKIKDFFHWMRAVGYDECVIERYYSYTIIPELNLRLKDNIGKKPMGFSQANNTIIFYDIIPTDPEATYRGMDIGEAVDCTPMNEWPDFCSNPISADYKFVENYWEKVFGMDFNFQYERIELSYLDEFGSPVWSSVHGQWQFNIPNSFYLNNIVDGSIAHIAIKSWNNQGIRPINGAKPRAAQMFYEPITGFKAQIYTHEWGHVKGLRHTFVDIDGVRTYLSPDGIMINTYRPITSLLDPLDPLERYVFEPTDNYTDQNTFANNYSQQIITTSVFNNNCQNIDPAVTSFSLDSTTDTEYIFKAIITNLGNMDASFIDVSLFQGNLANPPLVERTYTILEPNTSFDIYFTVDRTSISEDEIFIKIDPLNLITDETETNNVLSLTNFLDISNHRLSNSVVNIFPNPASDILKLEIKEDLNFGIKIFSTDGKLIFRQKNNSFIDISKIANGLYILEITDLDSSQRINQKIIIER